MLFIFGIFLTKDFYEISHLFTYHLFVNYITKIFQTHKDGKFISATLEPNVVNFFGKFWLVSV